MPTRRLSSPETNWTWPPKAVGGRGWATGWDLFRKTMMTTARVVTPASVHAGLTLAARAERLAAAFTRSLTAADIAELLGPGDPAKDRRLARTLAESEGRRQLLTAVRDQRGIGAVDHWLADRGFEPLLALRRHGVGAILMFFHQTATEGIAPILLRHRLPVLVLRTYDPRLPYPSPLLVQVMDPDDPKEAWQGLRSAIAKLRDGVSVLIAGDGDRGQAKCELPFLNGALAYRGGVAFLHRLTGAPVIPITTQWQAGTSPVLVTAHPQLALPPIDRADKGSDAEITAIVAAWIDQYCREHPEELRISYLRKVWRPNQVSP